MKVLQLCLKPPLPANDGGCIAMHNITMGLLAEGHWVKILTIFTQKHDFNPDELPQEYLNATGIEGVFVDTRVNAVDAFANFMTSDSYNIARFFSTDYDIKLAKLLQKERFDIIHLESLFMTPYVPTIRRYSKTPIVLRSHNLEFVIWEKIAFGTTNFFKRLYLKYLANKLRNYELSMLNEVSGVASISEEDRNRFLAFGVKKRVKTIPFGIDMNAYKIDPNKKPELAMFHLGAMDWAPNQEGVLWFLSKIWPRIHERFPEMKLYLAGRNMSHNMLPEGLKNVEVVGEVDDAKDFMISKSIMIVPLLSAGGIRVKIIEGLALGKAVISTTLGAEGLGCEHRKNILLADRIEEWVDAVDLLLKQPELIKNLGENGRQHVQQNFSIKAITSELVQFYKELIKG